MPSYWVTFRLASNTSYKQRYDDMMEAMQKARNGSWAEPTSFWLVSSDLGTDALTRALSVSLSPATDLLVVCDLATNDSAYYGTFEYLDVFKEYLPAARKLG